MDLTKMVHFAIRILTPVLASISLDPVCKVQFAIHTFLPLISVALPLAKHSDSLKNVARQNRTKIKENLEFIACAEGDLFFKVTEWTFSLNLLFVTILTD